MEAIKFDEVNVCIGESQSEYESLPVHIDVNDPATPTTMCFELNEEERKQIAETGQVWITILTFGANKPFNPIAVSVTKPKMQSNGFESSVNRETKK